MGSAALKLAPQSLPIYRRDCSGVPRPCPHLECRHHLWRQDEAISQRCRSTPPRGAESCALDVAENGPLELRAVGELMGLSHERVRQIEHMAIAKLRSRLAMFGITDVELRDEVDPTMWAEVGE